MISNILLQKQNCSREQVSASKNFCFDQQKLLFGLIVFSQKRDMDRDKKLNSILRRHYGFLMTALGENIFRIGRSRESQLAVIIKS